MTEPAGHSGGWPGQEPCQGRLEGAKLLIGCHCGERSPWVPIGGPVTRCVGDHGARKVAASVLKALRSAQKMSPPAKSFDTVTEWRLSRWAFLTCHLFGLGRCNHAACILNYHQYR